jgi:hypothetical protein
MGYAIPCDEHASAARAAVVANAWTIIRREVGALDLGSKWVKLYHDRSLTVQNQKRTHMVKITLEGVVYVDETLRSGEIKSSLFKEADVAKACALARIVLLEMKLML